MGLALVEQSPGVPPDEHQLQDAAYQVIRQGIDHANNELDGVKAGIDIALRAFCLARKREAHEEAEGLGNRIMGGLSLRRWAICLFAKLSLAGH